MSEATTAKATPPCGGVDEILPTGRLTTLGLQHVMVMYAGAVAVPIIIGNALGLTKEQVMILINADLLCCGIITMIQAWGLGPFGIRLPVMMGVSFAAVTPMVAIGTSAPDPITGLTTIFGACIIAGIFSILISPIFSRLMGLFPPVVTGTIITVIGVTLMRVGLGWVGGGNATIKDEITGAMIPNPDYGSLENITIALVVLAIILLITKFARGFLANVAVLIGLACGFFISLFMGRISFEGMNEASWVSVVTPFHFGLPTFDFGAGAIISLIMIVIMVESLGMFIALGEICDRPATRQQLVRGLRTDGLGTLVGGILNTFPHSSFSQNVGLVSVTGVRSRWVCIMGGLLLIALGLFPKMAFIVASIPLYVLGGAGIVMFGMVASTGIKILLSAGLERNRYNPYIIAISLGFGMIPLVAEHLFDKMPESLQPLLHSGILLAAVSAILLNLFFNGLGNEPRVVKGEEGASAEPSLSH